MTQFQTKILYSVIGCLAAFLLIKGIPQSRDVIICVILFLIVTHRVAFTQSFTIQNDINNRIDGNINTLDKNLKVVASDIEKVKKSVADIKSSENIDFNQLKKEIRKNEIKNR
jgi:hypothetical protein